MTLSIRPTRKVSFVEQNGINRREIPHRHPLEGPEVRPTLKLVEHGFVDLGLVPASLVDRDDVVLSLSTTVRLIPEA